MRCSDGGVEGTNDINEGDKEMKTGRMKDLLQRRILGEFLEPRHLLSAVGFVAHEIDAGGPMLVHGAADLDGDGDMDVLAGSQDGAGWFENTDGKGTFGEHQLIHPRPDRFLFYLKAHPVDMDGDKDLDLLVAGQASRNVVWYENPTK